MLEIPESRTIGLQAEVTLAGKTITDVFNATSRHKFAFFSGDPMEYGKLLAGKKVVSVKGHGMFVDIHCDQDIHITAAEGAIIKYFSPAEVPPDKFQLLIVFDDNSYVSFNIAMYGGIWAYRGIFDNSYHRLSLNSASPLDDTFDEIYFENIVKNTIKDLSAKALLATEQRIPGIGNGVLQDILFNAGIHPRRKKSSLSDKDKNALFHSIKATLKSMTELGGRDTEKDFFGEAGGYKTLLSKNTVNKPCRKCGDIIKKEAYLGGAVYFCPTCQK